VLQVAVHFLSHAQICPSLILFEGICKSDYDDVIASQCVHCVAIRCQGADYWTHAVISLHIFTL